MSTRKVSSMRCLGRIFFIALIALVAMIEVLVAVKFQFPEIRMLNFLPEEAATIFAAWTGAMLWTTLIGAVWTETYKKSVNGLTFVEASVATSVSVITVYGAIVGPFAFAVWANALLWSFAVMFFCRRFGKAED